PLLLRLKLKKFLFSSMASKKAIDLTISPEREELDLVLSLGRDDKGKQPMEGSQVRDTKRKRQDEGLVDDKISQTSEVDLLKKELWDLKREVIRLENLMRGQYQDLGAKLKKFSTGQLNVSAVRIRETLIARTEYTTPS
ncbi:hypothetical protein, partial [Streptococcus uberis]|uniref:hypothetical protein n=1 Tax=Streptococcus uberis TaxID=1349 RepID=UPI003D6C2792